MEIFRKEDTSPLVKKLRETLQGGSQSLSGIIDWNGSDTSKPIGELKTTLIHKNRKNSNYGITPLPKSPDCNSSTENNFQVKQKNSIVDNYTTTQVIDVDDDTASNRKNSWQLQTEKTTRWMPQMDISSRRASIQIDTYQDLDNIKSTEVKSTIAPSMYHTLIGISSGKPYGETQMGKFSDEMGIADMAKQQMNNPFQPLCQLYNHTKGNSTTTHQYENDQVHKNIHRKKSTFLGNIREGQLDLNMPKISASFSTKSLTSESDTHSTCKESRKLTYKYCFYKIYGYEISLLWFLGGIVLGMLIIFPFLFIKSKQPECSWNKYPGAKENIQSYYNQSSGIIWYKNEQNQQGSGCKNATVEVQRLTILVKQCRKEKDTCIRNWVKGKRNNCSNASEDESESSNSHVYYENSTRSDENDDDNVDDVINESPDYDISTGPTNGSTIMDDYGTDNITETTLLDNLVEENTTNLVTPGYTGNERTSIAIEYTTIALNNEFETKESTSEPSLASLSQGSSEVNESENGEFGTSTYVTNKYQTDVTLEETSTKGITSSELPSRPSDESFTTSTVMPMTQDSQEETSNLAFQQTTIETESLTTNSVFVSSIAADNIVSDIVVEGMVEETTTQLSAISSGRTIGIPTVNKPKRDFIQEYNPLTSNAASSFTTKSTYDEDSAVDTQKLQPRYPTAKIQPNSRVQNEKIPTSPTDKPQVENKNDKKAKKKNWFQRFLEVVSEYVETLSPFKLK